MAKKIPLTVFVFDVLHLEGRSLLEESFTARRQILEKLFTPAYRRQANVLQLSRHQLTTEPQVLEAALKEALGKQLEGIVVKNLSATYQAGSRGFHWVKLKAGTAALGKHRAGGGAGLPDTLDCLVLGVYRGRGARAAFGVGGLLLGARGKNSKFYSLTRLGSGLSESQLQEIKKLVGKLKVKEQPLEYEVLKEAAPDFWLAPALVVEVLADEISFSPRHTAGLSLRFPRLVRFRSDKGPNEVTTVEEVQRLYQIQKGLSTS
jgi:DNA ligase-1